MVELIPYSSGWAEEYRREADRVIGALAGRVDAVEHIGSTAVPGLLAKPVIDLAACAAAGEDPFGLGSRLAGLGYALHRDGPKNHGVYVRGNGGRRTHILHVFDAEQWPHCHQRLFRDKLLHDAAARDRYAALKATLAADLDGRAYTAAKSALIQELLDEERADRGLPLARAWDK